jgi:cysteine synthase B
VNTLEQTIGNTPLVRLQRMVPGNGSEIWVKLEGNNPAGSVKDRAALSMIVQAELRGEIKPGDVLIEATSGNTGIALAMIAALKGYRMKLLMPDNMSQERRAAMRAYGAELILVTKEQGMEGARDLALEMAERGEGKLLDQFNNPDNPYAHYTTTGPEIWQQTGGRMTHFVSSMGTTGTITGVSRFLREQPKAVTIVARFKKEGVLLGSEGDAQGEGRVGQPNDASIGWLHRKDHVATWQMPSPTGCCKAVSYAQRFRGN